MKKKSDLNAVICLALHYMLLYFYLRYFILFYFKFVTSYCMGFPTY